jgi:uncharacterized protein YbjT (DUF2867 family)
MITVFGAAGACGRSVVKFLRQRGASVRGVVQSEARGDVARAAGADEIAICDLRRIETVEAAVAGASAVFYLSPKFIGDEASIGRMVIDAVIRAGVKRFVFQSVLHSTDSKMLHHEAKREIEAALHESELEFTVLQPARFMHNVSMQLDSIIASGVYDEPFSSDKPIADVDYDDVAAVAALALTEPGYSRATFELSAEGMMNRHQRAKILSDVLGRPVEARQTALDKWLASKPARALSPFEREARALMFSNYDQYGFQGGNGFVLKALLGRAPNTYRTFLTAAVAAKKA